MEMEIKLFLNYKKMLQMMTEFLYKKFKNKMYKEQFLIDFLLFQILNIKMGMKCGKIQKAHTVLIEEQIQTLISKTNFNIKII